jgi:pheromone shutdown protein TraB
VYQTLGDRNAVIAENIAEILDEREGSSRGCLVVGHKHMDGVIEELEKNDVVVGKTHKSKFLRRAE